MLLYVHRNRKAYYDGKPRTATSTFTQLLNFETSLKCDPVYVGVYVVLAFCKHL